MELRKIQVEIIISDKGIASSVNHEGYGVNVTTSQVLETVAALDNIKATWLAKLGNVFQANYVDGREGNA